MATGLEEFANHLKGVKSGEFKPEPYYESKTDSLIFYRHNTPSYSKRINKYLTVFLSDDGDNLVGVEIKGLSVIMSAVENLGDVEMCDPVSINDDDGTSIDLSVFVRCSLVTDADDEPVKAKHYEELDRVARGVKIRPELCTN